MHLGLKNVSWHFSGSFLAVTQTFLCMICINMSPKRHSARRNTSISQPTYVDLSYSNHTICAFIAGCALEIWKRFLLKGEMIFSYRVSQLVCWLNSQIFILNKRFKCVLFLFFVHKCDSCVLRPLVPLRRSPNWSYSSCTFHNGRQRLPLNWSAIAATASLIERKTVAKSCRCRKPNKSLF